MLDPYKALQVAPTADQEVVDAAFRALAKKYHPDRDKTRHAARRMAELNAAYAVVREPVRRAQFDRSQRQATYYGSATNVARPTPTSVPPPPRSETAGTRL